MPVSVSAIRKWEVFKRDGYACQTCGSEVDLCVDHIIPLSLGGSDLDENLQTLCRRCNSSKGKGEPKTCAPSGRRRPDPRFSVLITIRVTPELRDQMNVYAKDRGKTVADVLRGAMEKAVSA